MKALANLYERVRTRLSRPADAARRRTQIGLSANAEPEARQARSLCVSAE